LAFRVILKIDAARARRTAAVDGSSTIR